MRAQQHEVEAWVNPGAWPNPAEGRRAIEAIIASGSDDEADWVRLAGGDDAAIAEAEIRDIARRYEREDREQTERWWAEYSPETVREAERHRLPD